MIENKNIKVEAVLYSAEPPSKAQEEQLINFLKNKYNEDVTLSWREDKGLEEGFRLEVGTIDLDEPHPHSWKLDYVYDWSLKGRIQQLKEITHLSIGNNNIIPLIKNSAYWTPKL